MISEYVKEIKCNKCNQNMVFTDQPDNSTIWECKKCKTKFKMENLGDI